MTFVAVSLCLFGLEVEEFATIARSSFSAFRVLEGEFNWNEMHNVGRFPAAAWVVLFSVVIGYIMLNMLLAIIMDTYRQLKGGERVSLPHIVKHLRPVLKHLRPSLGGVQSTSEKSANAVITKQTFMAAVPNLQEKQAERLLRN